MKITFRETLKHIKADIYRKLTLQARPKNLVCILLVIFNRGVVSVLIYRLKRYFYYKNNMIGKVVIRLLRLIEFQYCHNEIDPRANIGKGLVLSDFGGVSLSFNNIIGENCTFMGKATPTLGAMEGIDIELDRIVIGDYCVIGPNVKVINPVSIANGVQISANSVVMMSIETPGALVSGFPAKKVGEVPIDRVTRWSPILSKVLVSE